jgi:hypothetical protein
LFSFFPVDGFIVITHLQSNQYSNNHEQYLTQRIEYVLAEFIVSEKSLTDLAEEAEHQQRLVA